MSQTKTCRSDRDPWGFPVSRERADEQRALARFLQLRKKAQETFRAAAVSHAAIDSHEKEILSEETGGVQPRWLEGDGSTHI